MKEKKRKLNPYILSILIGLASFLFILLLIFLLPYLLPGDPVTILSGVEENDVSAEYYERYRNLLGLDQSIFVQFGRFLKEMFSFSFGYSYRYESEVGSLLLPRILVTLQYNVPAALIASALGIAIGLLMGVKNHSPISEFGRGITLFLNAFPSFLIALILLVLFAFIAPVFPSGGLSSPGEDGFFDRLYHLFLPILSLVLALTPAKIMQVYGLAAKQSHEKYVILARANGFSTPRIAFGEVMPNLIGPLLLLVAITFGSSFAGSVVIERIFSLRGVGDYLLSSIKDLDYPSIRGTLFITSLFLLVCLTLADLGALLIQRKKGE